jgi:hypothetical protein
MLQLSEKWARCESIRGRDKNINLRVGSMGPHLYKQRKGGPAPGSGTLNGVLNNLQSWYKGCWGCGDQANYLMLQLQASGPSGWQYITQGVDPVLGVYTHYITVALPDYPGNPVIFMDPWRNEINVVGPPQ